MPCDVRRKGIFATEEAKLSGQKTVDRRNSGEICETCFTGAEGARLVFSEKQSISQAKGQSAYGV